MITTIKIWLIDDNHLQFLALYADMLALALFFKQSLLQGLINEPLLVFSFFIPYFPFVNHVFSGKSN